MAGVAHAHAAKPEGRDPRAVLSKSTRLHVGAPVFGREGSGKPGGIPSFPSCTPVAIVAFSLSI